MPQAASLAEEISKQIGFTPQLIKGSRGVFDIHKDGKLVYSKHEALNQFPQHDQIIEALR
ncbi:MAG: Rdx family protein [Mariniblastus sp.]|nr:Rdx family protein [Mariniblastus sp.]